jgi:hypothetical protein
MLGTPPVLWLQRKRIPSFVAVLLVVAGMVAILLIVGAIVGASINSFYTELPVYQTRFQEQVSAFQKFLTTKSIRGMDKVLLEYVKPGAVMSLTARGVGLGAFEHCPDPAHRSLHPVRGLKLSRQAPRCSRSPSAGLSPVHQVRK